MVVFVKYTKHLVLPDILSEAGRAVLAWHSQKKAVVIEFQSEKLHLSGAVHHWPIEIVIIVAKTVVFRLLHLKAIEQ